MSSTTIIYKGTELDVEYTYEPEEAQVMYYTDGSGYEGSPEAIYINEITYKGHDMYELLEDQIEEIETYMLENKPERD